MYAATAAGALITRKNQQAPQGREKKMGRYKKVPRTYYVVSRHDYYQSYGRTAIASFFSEDEANLYARQQCVGESKMRRVAADGTKSRLTTAYLDTNPHDYSPWCISVEPHDHSIIEHMPQSWQGHTILYAIYASGEIVDMYRDPIDAFEKSHEMYQSYAEESAKRGEYTHPQWKWCGDNAKVCGVIAID